MKTFLFSIIVLATGSLLTSCSHYGPSPHGGPGYHGNQGYHGPPKRKMTYARKKYVRPR